MLLPLFLSLPIFLGNFPVMVSNQQLLAKFGLMVISALGCFCFFSANQFQAQGLFGYVLSYIGGDLIGCGT
jgi:hypothetical protein